MTTFEHLLERLVLWRLRVPWQWRAVGLPDGRSEGRWINQLLDLLAHIVCRQSEHRHLAARAGKPSLT